MKTKIVLILVGSIIAAASATVVQAVTAAEAEQAPQFSAMKCYKLSSVSREIMRHRVLGDPEDQVEKMYLPRQYTPAAVAVVRAVITAAFRSDSSALKFSHQVYTVCRKHGTINSLNAASTDAGRAKQG